MPTAEIEREVESLRGDVDRHTALIQRLQGSLLADADRWQGRSVERPAQTPDANAIYAYSVPNDRWQISAPSAATAHNILSASHLDTVGASVVRGDLLTGQGAPATWQRLALGASGQYMRSDGVDAAWSALLTADIPAHAHSLHTGLGGDDHAAYGVIAQAESVTGLWNFIASGVGGLGDYDVTVGDVATPDYGIVRMGDSCMGRTSHVSGSLDLDGAVIFRNMGGPVGAGEIEFVWVESAGASVIRFALPKAGAGNATYNPRSMLIAGPAVNDDDVVKVSYWQGQGIFDNLACDTGGDGADLGVQNDLEVEGDIFVDSIKESTSGAGVTIADNVGIAGAAATSTVALHVSNAASTLKSLISATGTTTTTDTTSVGLDLSFRHDGAVANATIIGAQVEARSGSSGFGSFDLIIGLDARVGGFSTGATAVDAIAIRARTPSALNNTDNAYGVFIESQGSTGSNVSYALYVADQTVSPTKWSIYQTGTSAPNVFNANTGIGAVTAPNATLDVTGEVIIDGNADAVQLTVQGHSTQTSDVLVVEKSDGTDLFTVDNDGAVLIDHQGASPFLAFHVRSSANFNIDFTRTGGVLFRMNAGAPGGSTGSLFGNVTNHPYHMMTNDTIRLTVEAAGDIRVINSLRVGADTSPTVPLDVTGAALISSTLGVTGLTTATGLALAHVAKTGAYTATSSDHVITCDASGGAFTVTLPAASGIAGRIYHIKKIDSSGNAVTVDGNASETIDGDLTKVISVQYDSMMIICDGSNWHII